MDTWIHNFGNFKMVLDKTDVDISRQIKESGWYEDEKFESQIFSEQLKQGMIVLDLGGNIGFYTILARNIVGKQGKVITFEPFPRNANLIRSSIKENSFDNVTVVEAAVSDRIGKTILYLSPDACSEHSLQNLNFKYNNDSVQKNIQVNIITVDDYLTKNGSGNFKVDFIKMDIEGSENRAIKGMKKVLEENKHMNLMTEFWPNGFKVDGSESLDFLEVIESYGFEINHLDNLTKSVYPVTSKSMMEIVEERSNNIPKENKVMQDWGWYTNLLCKK
jgi:FkbM family methyltransferase